MHPTASLALRVGFSVLSVAVAALLIGGFANAGPKHRRHIAAFAVATWGWLALTGLLGGSGFLTHWEWLPPPLVPVAWLGLGLAFALSRSRVGVRMAQGLPIAALVGVQAFRLPLELLMHAAASEGTMPVQMTFGPGGFNYDILTGLSAVGVALLAANGKASPALLRAWNYAGIALLVVIVAVAVVSTPTFAAFGQGRLNTWVAYFPFVWLITLLVPVALLGHLLLLRRLRADAHTAAR